ncbi:NAD(P)-binding protein [Arcticibacter tournemirensis]|uniref:FAD-dependent oxidoreductase n=1 Tax=Arcticibacter tournemirensis TaxID=699437 RepID=A0A4Q0MAE2_9SPHI|nr:NAD(P)-binding protein [Arcticibacter tournemirensis]RXF70144.1 hypothetical protein EKH83_09690 [Arcticibacter tournemirensis]
MVTCEIAVIGGGISGLAFAHYVSLKGHQVKVFEKEKGGGCIHSYFIDQHYIDFGAHTLTNRYAVVLEILEHHGAADQICKPLTLKFEGYGKNGFFRLFSKINWIELLHSAFTGFGTKKQNLSVRSFYSKILGTKNYLHFFHYLFQAILCQDPDHYPAGQLFRKRRRNRKYPKSFSLKKGLDQILDIIAGNPSISTEYYNITKITKEGELHVLWSGPAKVAQTKSICLACDPKSASLLLGDGWPALAGLLRRFPVVQVQSLLIGSNNAMTFSKRNKSLIGFDQPFYSAILYVIDDVKYWLFHFKENTMTVAERIRMIGDLFAAKEEEIYVVAAKSALLPAVSVECLALQSQIDMQTRDSAIFITGNYMNGLSVEDCCSRAKNEAERFHAAITQNPG